MFKVKFVLLAAIATSCLLALNSCTENPFGDNTPNDTLEIFKDDPNHSIFAQIHEQTGYIRAGETIFAPTDAAFEEYFNANGLTLATMSENELKTLLEYHYLNSQQSKASLKDGFNDTQKTYYHDYSPVVLLIERDSTSRITLNRSANITRGDIEAREGVLHRINKVLEPATSMDLARFENLDSFVVAMDRVDAATGIYEIIEGSGTYSIIAPRNQAFVEGLANNGWNSIADVPIDVLEHAMKEQIFVEHLRLSRESSETTYSLNGNGAFYDGGDKSISKIHVYDAKIVQFETQGINGTLLITDEVFLF